MNDLCRWIGAGLLCSASLVLAACGGNSSAGSAGLTPITVGGMVTGLVTGASIELQNNAGNSTTISANGSYTFTSALINGANYDVTISQQPAGENCTVSNGSGTVSATGVANVLVNCTPENYTVGGSLAGLLSGRSLVLQDNGGNSTTLSTSANFNFSIPVPSGSNYAVTIATQPAGQNCAVANGSGIVAAANVTNVSVSCSDNTYNVGVTISGVNASGLSLQDNGADTLSVASNGTFNFNAPIASGSGYAITIQSQPLGETCTVANGSGTIVSGNVTNPTVSCIPNPYPISGVVSGLLNGRNLTLQNNGGNSTAVLGNGPFAFSTPVPSGSNYSVTVFTQPAGQSCAVTNGSGMVAGANISNVTVACSDNTYNIGVAVSGVIRGGLILQNNGGDNLSVSADGSFNFAAPVPSGSSYAVTVLAQPAGETCTVTSGGGTVVAANITGIPVICVPTSYSIGGLVTGLLANNSLVLEDNGGNDTTLSANGIFGFSGEIASGSAYAVTVANQPPGQNCTVSNGSGTVVSSNVTSVGIACSDNTYNVAVTVSGLLSGTSLVLQDNGGDNLTVASNGSSNFPTPIASGSAYAVTILSQALGENCTLTNANGIVTSSNVSVAIDCVANNYMISGAVSGLLSGNSIVLQNNASDSTTVSANATFNFPTPVPSGSAYSVTISNSPPGQTCAVSNGTGTVAGANISNVTIACSDNTYNIGVTVSGLNASGLVLQDNGGDNLATSANGSVNFATPIPSGSTYAVTVLSQPAGESCTVTSGSGTVTSANIFGIPVSCVPNTYTIGGNVSGLGSGSLVIQNNGADNLTVSTNGSFVFDTPIVAGAPYSVTILTPPSGQTCSITNAAGTVADANVTNVSVVCGGEWTWVSGSATPNALGSYGSLGVASSGSLPGARSDPGTWTDAAGNLWMFGGVGYGSLAFAGYLSDLWKFNPQTATWEWVSGSNVRNTSGVYGTQGVASTSNMPGGRTSPATWRDSSGNLWLFGGASALNSQLLNDLWKFNPSDGTWEWVSGSSSTNSLGTYGTQGVPSIGNAPPSRQNAVAWTDSSGNFWLFGGFGYSGYLNDLWEFNPTAGTWEWVSGTSTVSAYGVYGTQGVASASNMPGGRYSATGWADSAGNLWLFGGAGYAASTSGYLNDLWKYNISAGTWEWVTGIDVGSNATDPFGVYGTQGIPSTSNSPGARIGASAAVDASGALWLFGGGGYASSDGGELNDLWKFEPATGTWEWVAGLSSAGGAGVYGTQGVAASGNTPGSRNDAGAWTDANGNIWLFGGGAASGPFNDMWEFIP